MALLSLHLEEGVLPSTLAEHEIGTASSKLSTPGQGC